MSALIHSFAFGGLDAYPVDVEAVLLKGKNRIQIIGMADVCVREAGERIRAAINCSGYGYPSGQLVVSLMPSEMKKRGSHFDLPMALAVLVEAGEVPCLISPRAAFLGELSLDGRLRPVKGMLAMAAAAKEAGMKDLYIPFENAEEAGLVTGMRLHPCRTLADVVDVLCGRLPMTNISAGKFLSSALSQKPDEADPGAPASGSSGKAGTANPSGKTLIYPSSGDSSVYTASGTESVPDFSDVIGQKSLLGAVLLACAGGHNLILVGPPGCGKTMIAERIPGILPPLTEEESLEVTKIYSASGHLDPGKGLIRSRPFRAPHHSASMSSLIGGGSDARPGEVTLAHNGVLFLDELPEFPRRTLEALRQPLENRHVTVSRVGAIHDYPASFLFVAAMNPCPCGYSPYERCHCSDYEIARYRQKISGPILDRIDIQKRVEPVSLVGENDRAGFSSAEMRDRVCAAREIQAHRFREEGIQTNTEMTSSQIERYCHLDSKCRSLLNEICAKRGYSARTAAKFIRMARTSADLAGAADIREKDLIYVLSVRDLDISNAKLIAI